MENFVDRKDLLHDLKQYKRSIELEYKLEELKAKRLDTKDTLHATILGSGFYGIGSSISYLLNQKEISAFLGVIFIGMCGLSTYYGIKEAVLYDKEKSDDKELKLIYSELEN